MDIIATSGAPAPAGHYSQGICHNGFVFVSGMLPITPGGEKVYGTMAEQTRQVLENVDAVLQAANTSRDKVIKVTIYVSDIEHWDEVNQEFGAFFGSHRPARAVVPTRDLHFGLSIEMEVVAACAEKRDA